MVELISILLKMAEEDLTGPYIQVHSMNKTYYQNMRMHGKKMIHVEWLQFSQ